MQRTVLFLWILLLSLFICGCDLPEELAGIQQGSGSTPVESGSGERVETGTNEDGSHWENTYNEKGVLVQSVITREAGDWDSSAVPAVKEVTTYNDQGRPVKSDVTYSSGDKAIITYHENGTWASCETIRPDGTSSLTTYDTDGNVLDLTDKDAAGNVIKDPEDDAVYTYHPDGSVASKSSTLEDGGVIEEYYDESGLLTKFVERTADGYILERYYDKNRVLVQSVDTCPDGTSSIKSYFYDAEGKNQKTTVHNSDGSYSEVTCYPGGRVASHILNVAANGYRDETFYSEEEVITRWIYTQNGITYDNVYTYYENGKKASEIMDGTDGSHSERIFFENGNVATDSWTTVEGHFNISRYNAAGIEVYQEHKNEFGYSKQTCRDDGTREYYLFEDSGSRNEVYFHPNGNKHTYEVWFSDGAYLKETCDETGKVLTAENISADNWHTIRTYNADGSSVQLTTRSDGSTLKVTYDAAGNVLSTEDSNKNWQSAE